MSVMDMNSRMAMAEKLSVQQLQQAIQSGSIPAYIGIPLIEQKTKERAQMAAAQGGQPRPPSVASQILQQAEQEDQGITQLPSNLPMMDDEEMGMAGGGIVAFADEGQVVDPNAPAVPPAAVSKYGDIPAMSPEGRAKFAEYEGLLQDLRGKGGSEREQAKAMAIFQAGLGMMGGTSPNAFANIAAGAMPAITQYQSALKDLRKEDRDTLKQMLDLGVSKEQFLQKAQQMGVDIYKADKAYDATMGAARINAASRATEKPPRAPTTTDIALDYIEGKAKDYISQGVEPAKAKILAQQDYYAQSRPMQPSAGIAPAVTSAQEKDEVLQNLGMQFIRARNDPEKQKDIQEKIDARKAVVAGQVAGYGTSGRGVGGTSGTGGTGGATTPPTPAPTRQPLPMPKSAADAVVGEIYNTARGPAKWDGKQFVLVP